MKWSLGIMFSLCLLEVELESCEKRMGELNLRKFKQSLVKGESFGSHCIQLPFYRLPQQGTS